MVEPPEPLSDQAKVGEEGMGAAAVGKGHRNTTYTGYRGPEAPKGKGRRRERDRERAQLFLARERERDPAFRPVYTESASAPGVEEPEVRDPASLMGVKSTNSPDRVEVTQTPPRSRLSPVVAMRSHLNRPGNLI